MKNYFAFIDETGLLTTDPKQRYFAIGLLRIDDVADFYNQISKLYHKVISRREAKRRQKIKNLPSQITKSKFIHLLKSNKRFEFKFNLIDQISVNDYLKLVNIYFQFPHLYFCVFVIDTQSPSFNFLKYFPNSWEAYVGYSKMLVRSNCLGNDRVAVIADYVQMAHGSTKYFERQINQLRNVFNTCRVESNASLFIQIVDVLLGAVVYDFKLKAGIIGKEDPKHPKTRVVLTVRDFLNRKSLARKFTAHKPNYFSVWPFRTKPKE